MDEIDLNSGIFVKSLVNLVSFQRACEANPAGGNTSFIFTVKSQICSLHNFKLA